MKLLLDSTTRRRLPRIPAGILVLLAALAAVPAAAQTDVCLPPASGVPALSGPPNWWDSGLAEPQHWPRPDDPRWRGAFVHLPMPGSSATEHVTFRGLRTASTLYLIWWVTVDPLLDSNDQLWVGFSPNTAGQDDVLVHVLPFNTAGDDVPAMADDPLPSPFAVTVLRRTAGNMFMNPGTLPAWINPASVANHTRVFRRAEPGGGDWAILMEVPVNNTPNNGVGLANDFTMWFEVQVSHPPAMMGDPPGMVPYRFPATVSFDDVAASLGDTGWQDTRRNTAVSDPSCVRGVSLTVADVGVVPAGSSCSDPTDPLSSRIELDDGGGNPGSNVLCARPLNETGDSLAASDVDATFRLANWGTQPDWNDVPDPLNTLWTTVNPTPATGGAISNGAKGALGFTWNLVAGGGGVNDVCTFDPQPPGLGCGALPLDPRKRHQCMLVELSGAPPLTFSTSSVYRNMDFVEASTFRREAEVSVVGLAPMAAAEPQRDVFLYVQTANMPARVTGGGPRQPLPSPTPPPVPVPRDDDSDDVIDDDEDDQPPPEPVEPLEKAPYGELRETEPTYEVHAFHDTGETTTVNGTTFRILRPQTSFGYFVDHEGELEGWRHELIGAQVVAPDYYVIPVPENGTATVTTVIEAIEGSLWSLSLHAGQNDPKGDVQVGCDGDLSWGVDLEYRFGSMWAAELFYGHEDFDCGGGNDAEVEHLSLNGKAYFLSGTWRPFVGIGIGSYDFSPGPSEIGGNLFAGLQANLLPSFAVEGAARYHLVDAGSDDAKFLAYHLGLRFRF